MFTVEFKSFIMSVTIIQISCLYNRISSEVVNEEVQYWFSEKRF